MGTGQTLLTIGALGILSVMLLRLNTTYVSTNSILLDNKIKIFAVSVATSIIEDANKLSFDENTTAGSVTSTAALTTSSGLGIEFGENYTDFDDFDDYNYFRTSAKIDSVEVDPNYPKMLFYSKCSVSYVSDINPDAPLTTPTWHKKLVVSVTSPALLKSDGITQDTVSMSTVFSYWFFR